ncbi:MAG: hypothetical protein GIW95_08405 [Candidatus Eremiobacteraeota bacterium]|nr:hypothetical protein [Candidatus Eremiobacteraeota bacterium]
MILALGWDASAAEAAEQRYVVAGRDSFSIGAGDIKSETQYKGSQILTISRNGRTMRYRASVRYVRDDQGAATEASAEYVSDLSAAGEQIASADRDPDNLTVLNQPFAAQLDAATLKDLRTMRGTLPFDFPSPFTGATLHGRLERIGNGTIGAHHSIGVSFEAGGRMRGALPDRPGLTLAGQITMRGTAYYDAETALLVALDATVTITGNVSNRSGNDPVTIVYRRTIRADEPTAADTASRSRR